MQHPNPPGTGTARPDDAAVAALSAGDGAPSRVTESPDPAAARREWDRVEVRHRLFAAAYGAVVGPAIEAGPVGAARRELVAAARGVVVDLGSGTGANLPHLGPAVTQAHLVEPDPHMVRRLRTVAPEGAVVHQSGAERLLLDSGSVDTVLATLTLCTVADLPACLAEIRRVLRPDGRLLVLEHVRASDARFAVAQDVLELPWRWVAAGCRPNRETPAALAAAGFDTAGLTRFTVPGMPLIREWVTGSLARP